jgi:putative flippase GtrA
MTRKTNADGRLEDIRRFGGFAITGGIAALVNLVSRYAISLVTVYEVAVMLAYLVGMTTAFLLARRFVFEASGRSWIEEYGRFAAVNVVAFIQVWLVSVGLVRLVFPAIGFDWHAEEVGHLIGVASPIITSYYAHKNFSFKGVDPLSQPREKKL